MCLMRDGKGFGDTIWVEMCLLRGGMAGLGGECLGMWGSLGAGDVGVFCKVLSQSGL